MTNKEIREAVALLKQQADEQERVSSSLEGYINGLKKLKALNESINYNKKEIADLEAKQVANNGNLSRKEEQRLIILKSQTKELKKQSKLLRFNLEEVNKTNLVLSKIAANSVKTLKNFNGIPPILSKAFNKIKGLGLFEMDKAIKTSALQMGLLGSESAAFSNTIRNTAMDTNALGVGVQELAKMQSEYSEELGRTVLLGKDGLKAISAMASATSLGAEGAAQMAADMEKQGLSAERTAKYIEQSLDDAHKMGINASKVVKNIQQNIKLLNRYNFKDGVKGLAKMASMSSKLGVNMEFAASMADKLWDVEGAVEMSAQLQVMGGEWAKLSDPFKLMYMARNDVGGLTEALGNAAAASATFNSKNGDFEISAMEMHKLKIIADQTGVSYDDLTTAAKNAAKFAGIKKQMSYKFDDDTQNFIATTAKLDENGKAYIEIKGDKKLVSLLTNTDKRALEAQVKEKKSLEERARAAQTFDDKLVNLINMVKTTLLPIVDGISQVLSPLIDGLFKNEDFKSKLTELGKDIGDFVTQAAGVVKSVAQFALWLGPKGTLMTILGVKALGWLFEKANWIANGLALAGGFNIGTAGGGSGGVTNVLGNLTKNLGSLTRTLGPIAVTLGAGVGGGLLGKYLGKLGTEASGRESTETGDKWGTAGAIAGGLIGLALAPFTGGASLALTAAAVGGGALIGGAAGKYGGDYFSQDNQAAMNDGISNPVDGKLGYDRSIVSGGGITRIPNKDKLISMEKNGVIDKEMNKSSNSKMKIEFGEIKFSGSIMLETPGNPGIASDLLKDSKFVRDITRIIHVETKKQMNGGKAALS